MLLRSRITPNNVKTIDNSKVDRAISSMLSILGFSSATISSWVGNCVKDHTIRRRNMRNSIYPTLKSTFTVDTGSLHPPSSVCTCVSTHSNISCLSIASISLRCWITLGQFSACFIVRRSSITLMPAPPARRSRCTVGLFYQRVAPISHSHHAPTRPCPRRPLAPQTRARPQSPPHQQAGCQVCIP